MDPSRIWLIRLIAIMGVALATPAPAVPAITVLADAVWVAYRCTPQNRCLKGTAFSVGNGLFYTNAHVATAREGYGPLLLGRGTAPRITLGTADVVCLNTRAVDPAGTAHPYDIAKIRLQARQPTPPALPTTRFAPLRHSRVTVIGYPGSSWNPVIATGVVVDILPFSIFAYTVETGQVGPGSSGSPVLNDRNEVAGIHFGNDELKETQFAADLNFVDQVCQPPR